MSGYRRGAVLGLTVAETFILLTFLLIVALLGLIHADELPPEPGESKAPRIWVRPERIETLVNAAEQARKDKELAEHERAAAERERDQARGEAEQARREVEEAEQARADAKREHEQAQTDLETLRRKGKNPPCWYQIVDAGEGKTREKPDYAFNVAIREDSIELAPRDPPPGGAVDDGGGPYEAEWKRLQIGELPYGERLSDDEFTEVVRDLVAKGRNRQVRTYECVFSVMVWDKTPDHAKKRWKDAHDRIIEGSFSAYTVQDLVWKGFESWKRPESRDD